MKTLLALLITACAAGISHAEDLGRISTKVEGAATLNRDAGPVFIQFAGSRSMSEALRQDLKRGGFEVANSKGEAKQILAVKGVTSVRSSTGKVATEDMAVFAEGPRVPMVVPKAENEAPPQVPPGFETHGEKGPPITNDGMSVLGGYPVVGDLGDQGRGYARKLMAQGIGTDMSRCPKDGCKSVQILSQSATIDVEITKGGKIEKAKVVASMQSDTVMVDLVTARAMFLAIAMVKGQK
ncbi:MAG TPA: hypothetical protein PK999_12675 [Nitrospira sp.]|nr:hypothetical protein [Nitrospira sp.]